MILKHLLLLTISSIGVSAVNAGDYATTLAKIGEYNPSVAASKSLAEANCLENHTGLNLENPEVGFTYQWGSPAGIPDKKTIELTQSFDFATLSGNKKRVASARDKMANIAVKTAYRDATAQADALMTDIVFQRRLSAYYDSTLRVLNQLFEAAELSHKHGNISIIDINEIRMQLNTLITDAKINSIELETNLGMLSALAGGNQIAWTGADYLPYSLPADFNSWLAGAQANAPEIADAEAAAEVANSEISLAKSENLPTFSIGYAGELVNREAGNYHGVSVGLELPLWANSGKTKAAKAAKIAADIAAESAKTEFALRQQELYRKAEALSSLEQQARTLRDECDIRPGLKKLFASGEISVHEYLSQLIPLFELDKHVIETEHDYQSALTLFRAATLH